MGIKEILLCLLLVFGSFVICLIIYTAFDESPIEKCKDKENDTPHEPFDIYSETLKLQEEREKQEPYLITLWWGFDGLRLNADGSTEWISRRKEPKAATPRHGFSALPKSCFEDLSNNCGTIHPVKTEEKDTVESRLESLIQESRSRLEESGYKDTLASHELAALYRMKINLQSINAAKTQSAITCQNTTLQNMIYTQCQNAPYPSYPMGVSPYMTSYTPYWQYCAGGNFGTYKS